jgi:transcriptional regulator with XRE-family HTH domain
MKKIHIKIRQLRKINELSQENLALELGLSQSQYSRRENGLMDFTIKEIVKICKLFGVSYEDIINEEDLFTNNKSVVVTSETKDADHREVLMLDLVMNALEVIIKTDMMKEQKSEIINTIKSRLNKFQ